MSLTSNQLVVDSSVTALGSAAAMTSAQGRSSKKLLFSPSQDSGGLISFMLFETRRQNHHQIGKELVEMALERIFCLTLSPVDDETVPVLMKAYYWIIAFFIQDS